MISIDNNGSLKIKTKYLHLFSDSYYRDFCITIKFTSDFVVAMDIRDMHRRYFCVELSVKCLSDFCYQARIGDIELEFANVAHHENN